MTKTLLAVLTALVILPTPAGVAVIGVPNHCLLAAHAQLEGPGNPGHKEPPPGEACTHDAKDAAHNCACHRECKPEIDDEGNPVLPPRQYVAEDAKCRVYCFKDHCHCPIQNCD